MTESVNYFNTIGPARFYCLVDGCTEHVELDTEAYCEEHWVDVYVRGLTLPHRNGFTLAYWLELKAKQREAEKTGRGQSVVSSSVDFAQALREGQCTDGLGLPWPPVKAEPVPTVVDVYNDRWRSLPGGTYVEQTLTPPHIQDI